MDLRMSQSICTILQGMSADACHSKCLGYLDSCCDETFRHSFFQTDTMNPISEFVCISAEEIISLLAETSVTFVQQLTLARSFAMAVLKFHSTPWLRENISLRELSFFDFHDGDLSSCIRTAHLGFDFVQSSMRDDLPTREMGDREAFEEARLIHGVRNLTLWGLGTIMYVLLGQYIVVLVSLTSKMTRHSTSGVGLKPLSVPGGQQEQTSFHKLILGYLPSF